MPLHQNLWVELASDYAESELDSKAVVYSCT